jgi:cellulose synthase/poly-beta-1,6-N-acetylglucosamine synthase-like glycosyltransferase
MPDFFKNLFLILYTIALSGLSLFGLQSLVLTVLFLFKRRRATPLPPPPAKWPLVTVQLPIYNERYVAARLIDAVCALDYACDRLSVQVLDDSTDDTTALAQARIQHHQAQGINITLIHRAQRAGFKAGALAAGLAIAPGEFVAIFDADFLPAPDFLRRLIPVIVADPNLGAVQARWGHLNAAESPITRAQALALDGHFIVEQTARSRSGLPFNFNGSGGIWRRACIEAAGGWQGDTLSEDFDLSYRAQIAGWRLAYRPEVVAPAEVPPQITGFKRQQYRWAHGCIQVLGKLAPQFFGSALTPAQKLSGLLHMTSYLAYPLMLLALLCALPMAWFSEGVPVWLGWLALGGLGPPILYIVSQCATYDDWPKRLAFFPLLMGIGMGVALNNTQAVFDALRVAPQEFARTPKFGAENNRPAHWQNSAYALRGHWTLLGEWGLTFYAAFALTLAWERAPALIVLLSLLTWGFGLVALWGTWEVWPRR